MTEAGGRRYDLSALQQDDLGNVSPNRNVAVLGDVEIADGEACRCFGARPRDPIWPVDIFLPQLQDAPTNPGCMLADAQNGFPVPLYPRCLQKAHEAAALVDFDFAVLQDQIINGIRQVLGAEAPLLDASRVQERNPAGRRYR